MIGTVTLSSIRHKTNETGVLSTLSQQILCSENHVCLTSRRVCLTAEPGAFTYLRFPYFILLLSPPDTKQQVLIQYHPAVSFNWNLQHIQTWQELVIKSTANSSQAIDIDHWGIRKSIILLEVWIVLMAINEDAVSVGVGLCPTNTDRLLK